MKPAGVDSIINSSLTVIGWLRGIALLAFLLLTGCASIEPWVKPYERDNLADTIMSMNRNPVAIAYTHHAYQAREGARGAEGGAGGGCGCN